MSKNKHTKKNSKFSKIEEVESELEDNSYDDRIRDDLKDNSITLTKNFFVFTSISIFLVIVIGLWGVYYFSNKSTPNDSIIDNKDNVTVEQINRSLSGKSEEEDKKDAMSAAQNILNKSIDSSNDSELNDKITSLEDGDISVVSEDVKNKVRFTGEFQSDKNYQSTTYQAILVLAIFLIEDNEKIEPISEDIWEEVYLDQETGIAYVPLSVFYEKGTAFSLEMVYVDGEWKLAPYSILSAINLSSKLQDNTNNTEDTVSQSVPVE